MRNPIHDPIVGDRFRIDGNCEYEITYSEGRRVDYDCFVGGVPVRTAGSMGLGQWRILFEKAEVIRRGDESKSE